MEANTERLAGWSAHPGPGDPALLDEVRAALDDDLDTPTAVAAIDAAAAAGQPVGAAAALLGVDLDDHPELADLPS
jgi:L-cysteine:1D-myo-inositol 2-amino-2-deoxy-alpha-D-glucopyranoside ligase